ncbi:MAG: restriction endonuclease [Magnetococcales bacterium]|nr:restriction endonuclease [Magnetococcales bacterium]
MTVQFAATFQTDSVIVRLIAKGFLNRRQTIPFREWSDKAPPSSTSAMGMVSRILREHSGEEDPPLTIIEDGLGVSLSHRFVANLVEHQAIGLGLPPSTSLLLNVQNKGDIAQPTFEVTYRWMESSSATAFGVSVAGSILTHRRIPARIPQPLYSLIEAIDGYNSADIANDEVRFRHLSALQEIISERAANRPDVQVDAYIRNTIIVVASSFSLSLHADRKGFQLDPVLFGRKLTEAWCESEGAARIIESESLLPENYQKKFVKRFQEWPECRDRYSLDLKYYLYIDPSLRKALHVVRKVQGADEKSRREFARNPQRHLKEMLAGEFDENAIERLFIPTEEYSARIVDLAIWEPTVLPWIKRAPNSWLPENFGLMVGDVRIELPPEEIEDARSKVDAAIAQGKETVEIGGRTVPATAATQAALEKLIGLVRPLPGNKTPADPSKEGKQFLVVDENFETVTFAKRPKARAKFEYRLPNLLASTLLEHQEDGLAWLEECWCAGYPGVLLADDMGLGKTITALSFLAWLRKSQRAKRLERRPILIVAPVGLLKNWSAEHNRHLRGDGLGVCLKAYGTDTSKLKTGATKGSDIDQGCATLCFDTIAKADWVLTSYDALRDYHLSFAKVHFAAIVYDEAQKLKNPASQWARAAKAMNTDFTLAMTGTPIENRCEDLWAIFDVAYPGYLPEGKSFSKTYTTDDVTVLGELRAKMLDRQEGNPAVMLRRLKADQLKGLPKKIEMPVERNMPPKQADAYRDAVTAARNGSSSQGEMLRTLHSLRGISLHPIDPQQAKNCGHNEYVEWSARLAVTFERLREIQRKGEKVLIFLESLEMQDLLAQMLKKEFRMKEQPLLIHGGIPGDKRQEYVDAFQKQNRNEFDVMILSPKAGGVGLTLTAATHVIHLSRWWNPAVEDQCTDRAYRIGQGRDVTVCFPLAIHPDPDLREYSFDLKLHSLLNRKRELSRNVLIPPVSQIDESELFWDTVNGSRQGNGESDSLKEIDRMTPSQFESWLLRKMSDKGWITYRTPTTGDAGADGIFKDPYGNCAIIQAKHRLAARNCDSEAVDNLIRARNKYQMPMAQLYAITNAKGFTATAIERATRHGITLIARDSIMTFIK